MRTIIMREEFLQLNINDIGFDTDNPRIKMALEKYRDKITAKRINFALKTATPDTSSSTAAFEQLRGSIRAYGGLAQPITVTEKNGEMTCIDGNTRLAIFKEFDEKEVPGDWSKIPASLLRDAEQIDIEKIRTSAHLVGARPWPAYEKARYLDYLYNKEFMSFGEMVTLCGGNKAEVERQIGAFNDMNEFYRNVVEDTEFKIDRFSGFVELQKPMIKESIFNANLDLEDFGSWMKNGQISRLADVRYLPKVLRDEEAKQLFINGGINSISEAIRCVDDKTRHTSSEQNILLRNTPIDLLAKTLKQKMDAITAPEYREWRSGEVESARETVQALEDLYVTLEETLSDVRE